MLLVSKQTVAHFGWFHSTKMTILVLKQQKHQNTPTFWCFKIMQTSYTNLHKSSNKKNIKKRHGLAFVLRFLSPLPRHCDSTRQAVKAASSAVSKMTWQVETSRCHLVFHRKIAKEIDKLAILYNLPSEEFWPKQLRFNYGSLDVYQIVNLNLLKTPGHQSNMSKIIPKKFLK